MEEMQHHRHKVVVKEIIGFEHEFWVDVKSNRAKNGNEEDYLISKREIPNPNSTLLLTSSHPTLQVKYIVRRQKRKKYSMHFISKA